MTHVLADELIKPNAISVSIDTLLRHGVGRFEVIMKLNCSRCHEVKSSDDFYKNKRNKSGYADWCRVCSTQWRLDNGDIIRASNRASKGRRFAAEKAYKKDYFEKNKKKKAKPAATETGA